MRVLVPVDLKTDADRVVTGAATWAQRLGAQGDAVRVDLLYIDEMGVVKPRVSDPAVQTEVDRQWDSARTEQLGRLDTLAERLPVSRRGTPKIEIGAPAQAIVDAAAGYDLILLGTHQRSGMQRIWLGSVAERVVQLSTIPVLVLPLSAA